MLKLLDILPGAGEASGRDDDGNHGKHRSCDDYFAKSKRTRGKSGLGFVKGGQGCAYPYRGTGGWSTGGHLWPGRRACARCHGLCLCPEVGEKAGQVGWAWYS